MRATWEWLAVGLLLGELWACTVAGVVEVLAVGVGALSIACALLDRPGRGLIVATLAAAVGAVVGGMVIATPSSLRHVSRVALPGRYDVEGNVRAVRQTAEATTFFVEVTSVRQGDHEVATEGTIMVRARGVLPAVATGDVIAIRSWLRSIRNFENPGRYNHKLALARRGVHVAATVSRSDDVHVVRAAEDGNRPIVEAWRTCVHRAIALAATGDAAAVLQALVLGDQGAVAPELRDAFARAGVAHVLSVSGLHIALAGGAWGLAVGWVLRRSERLTLAIDIDKLTVVVGIVPATAYGLLAGFEVATFRSVVTMIAVAMAMVLGRHAGPIRVLAMAAVAVCLWLPGEVASASFQLSFVSVLALVAPAWRPAKRDPRGGHAWAALRASSLASAATAPLTAFHFHQVSVVGVVANPLVIPLFGSVVLLPGLAGAALAPVAPGAAVACFRCAALGLSPGLMAVRALGQWPWAAMATPLPNVMELMALYGILIGPWAWKRWGGRCLCVVAALVLVIDTAAWVHVRTRPGTLRATFLDVGQGDASVVELPDGRVLVVDAGGFAGSDFDTGAAIVEPFLRARKVSHVDVLVMTHAHPDHAGGLAHLIRAYRPTEVWWTGLGAEQPAWRAVREAMRANNVRARRLRRGDHIAHYDDVRVLHPPVGWKGHSLNDGSLVLRVTHGATSILLTGDVEAAGEGAMVSSGPALEATVLKVPHHGSRTSSTWAFVRSVQPAIAVVSAGAHNRYGHPAAEVVERYDRLGIDVLATARCGAVTVESDGTSLRTDTTRRSCAGDEREVRLPVPH